MTLVLTVNGPESIWLLADRRLTYEGQPQQDDARKVMFLETTDGVAILGYAGLGATAAGTEPADWMSAVLRGRNLPLEQSLGVLARAMETELPRHVVQLQEPAHNVLIPAFLGNEPRLYSIDLAFAPNRQSSAFRWTRHVVKGTARTPRLAIAGSGLHYLRPRMNKWTSSLLRVVKANDRGVVSPHTVADHLANLNYEVHEADKSVGPRCIVAWRHKKGGAVHKGGGGHQFYTEKTRDTASPVLPTIGRGMDIPAIVNVLMPHSNEMLRAMREGRPAKELDKDKINAELARLPDKPDENLR